MQVQSTASVHERTVQELARGELELARRVRGPDQRERVRTSTVKVHPRVWEVAMQLAHWDPRRIEVHSSVSVTVHNRRDWS